MTSALFSRTDPRARRAAAALLLSLGLSTVAGSARGDDRMVEVAPGHVVRVPLEPVSRADRDHVFGAWRETSDRAGSSSSTRRRSLAAAMPPVRDQGPRGACSVFAAVALLEYFEQRDLSEQCLAFLSGSDAGLTQDRLSYVRSHGVYLEQDCPYDANRYAIPDLRNAPLVQLPEEFEAFAATSMADPLEYIRQRIDYASPVAVAVWVVDRSGWYDDDGAAGFVYMPEEDVIRREFDDGVAGGHAIVITGYDDAWQLLQFRNSWSTRWGTGGYGYMSYDYFLRFRKSQIISY